jgi:hypothetical protein
MSDGTLLFADGMLELFHVMMVTASIAQEMAEVRHHLRKMHQTNRRRKAEDRGAL